MDRTILKRVTLRDMVSLMGEAEKCEGGARKHVADGERASGDRNVRIKEGISWWRGGRA